MTEEWWNSGFLQLLCYTLKRCSLAIFFYPVSSHSERAFHDQQKIASNGRGYMESTQDTEQQEPVRLLSTLSY